MVTEVLTAVFVLGLPLWLVVEELFTRMPALARAETSRPYRRLVVPSERGVCSAARTGPERVGG